MEFSEDFATIQSLLNNVYKNTGDFTRIRHVGGNEQTIKKVVECLQQFLKRKNCIVENVVSPRHEAKVRKIVLFLILNTEFSNKSVISSNKVAHLIGIMPQFSKCLLTCVIFELNLCQYYAEAISSLPAQISLELLEYCSKCIKRYDPYKIIKLTCIIASAIYFKAYHLRYESCNKIDAQIAKLLEKFYEVTKNYVSIVTDEILLWKTDKMYQYMGQTIYEILKLLKNCFNVFEMKEFVDPIYQFYQFTQENTHVVIDSPNSLNKSNDLLKELNKHLMSICEGNVIAITLDVFCSWVECNIEDGNLQEIVACIAYEVLNMVNKFEDTGDLPKMLGAIARKPKTIEDQISNADKPTILQNVQITSDHQNLWYKALIRSGILLETSSETEKVYDVFKRYIYLADIDDYAYLLNLNEIKNEFGLMEFLMNYLRGHRTEDTIKIVAKYFFENGINNKFELEDYDVQERELLNKLNCDESANLPFKDISILVLQNPIKFINSLLEESDKSVDHLVNILKILNFIKPICNLKCNDKEHTVFHEMVLNRLKYNLFQSSDEICVIELINKLIKTQLVSNIIYDQLQEIIEDAIKNSDYQRAIFICQLCKALPMSSMPCDNYIPVIIKLGNLIGELRWTFFTYSEDKVILTYDIINLIYHYKNNLQDGIITEENLKHSEHLSNNKIDSFHVLRNLKSETENFLTYVSDEFDVNSSHYQQVTRLIDLLPRCVPLEWDLVAKYLIKNKNPTTVIQLFIDVMLILSEMSKKSASDQNSLSYCFQQFCIVMKDLINSAENDPELEKSFIKNICRLIKHLPDSLHNTVEISLVNLFNFNVLKSLKNDEDFVYSLVSISHLNICKIICSKMA